MKFSGLAALDRNDLLRLADLLATGLLAPPLSALTLRDHIPDVHAAPVAQCLGELTRRDMPPAHIALLLRAFAEGAQATGGVVVPVEVVVSGPDATGGARDTGVVMRQLFGKALRRVVAVGFAVHQGKSVFKTLADRLDNDDSFDAILCVDIRRQRGDTSLAREIVQRFANDFVRDEWPGNRLPLVYYDPRSLEPTGRDGQCDACKVCGYRRTRGPRNVRELHRSGSGTKHRTRSPGRLTSHRMPDRASFHDPNTEGLS